MLEFNPDKRISVEEALQSEYLQSVSSRDTNESETLFPVPENLDMNRISLPTGLIDEEEFRKSVYEEIFLFHLDDNKINK
jgi:serine/threonine protein kinase